MSIFSGKGILGGALGAMAGGVGALGGALIGSNQDRIAKEREATALAEEQSKWQKMLNQPMPEAPAYEGAQLNNGLLDARFQLQNVPGYMEALKASYSSDPYAAALGKQALAQGLSEQAQAQQAMQQAQEATARDTIGRQQASGLASALSNLRMRGGSTGGAAERMAMGGSRAAMEARQGLARQGEQSRLGILASDQANKQGLMQNLSGREERIAGNLATQANTEAQRQLDVNRYNLDAAQRERALAEQAKLARFQTQAQQFGSAQNAGMMAQLAADQKKDSGK